MQLSVTVPPEIMFRNYLYVSGTSDTIPAHFAAYARDVADRFVPKDGLVVEIGSNDGTLLRAFDRATVRVLGVEPARNIAAMANAAGIPTLGLFGPSPEHHYAPWGQRTAWIRGARSYDELWAEVEASGRKPGNLMGDLTVDSVEGAVLALLEKSR